MQKLLKILTFILIISAVAINFYKAYAETVELPIHYQVKLTPIENEKSKKVWQAIQKRSLLLNAKVKATATASDLLILANSEYANILSILQDNAYFGATVSIKLNNIEVHNISSISSIPAQNDIIIKINTGQTYKIGSISMVGALSYSKFKLKSGDDANATSIKQLSLDAMKDLQNAGYAEAKIIKQKTISYDRQRRIDFFLKIKRGRKIYLNQIKIINETPKPNITNKYIAKLSGFTTGILDTPKTIDKYRENLEQLDLFSTIIINQTPSNNQGLADLTIIVTEKPKHNFSAGVNYDSKNGFGSDIGWLHRNLTGYGDHLTIKGSVNSLYFSKKAKQDDIKKNLNNYNYDYRLQYDVAGIISYNTHLALDFHGISEHNTYYKSRSLEAKAGIYKVLSNHILGSVYLTKATIKDDSVVFGNRIFNLIGVDNNIGVDWRDSTLEPHKGYLWNIKINPFYELRTSHLLTRLELEGRTYLPIDHNENYVLALRGQYGVIIGTNLRNIPSTMQYFAGGGDSLRGFRYRSVGLPTYLDKTNNQSAIGGLSMALFSTELRAHLVGNFSGVAFMDTAILGSNAIPKNKRQTGVGIGIRYKSPIGSIRLDIATPLKYNKYDGRMQLYIGIGEAF